MASDPTFSAGIDEQASNQRWAHWVAKGAEQERKVNAKVIVVAVLVGCGIVGWLTTMLALG
jgi:hypothetical protein